MKGLKRWFSEKWKDQKGNECGSGKLGREPKCRPSIKVTDKTPVTWSEMSDSEKKRAVTDKNKATKSGKQYGKLEFSRLREKIKR